MNTKIHTTSTKCQYQIAASNPTWTFLVTWWKIILTKHTDKKRVPIITWAPCNPVVIKNTDPKTLSEILKDEFTYSYPCNAVKKIANKIV